MKQQLLKNLLMLGLAAGGLASCAPMKTGFIDMKNQYVALGAVLEFDMVKAECHDGVAEAAILADKEGNAFLVRSECQNFEEPVQLNPEELESSPSGEEIKFREEVFELRREDRREERSVQNSEQRRSDREETSVRTEIPKSSSENPKSNTEAPRVVPEVPKSNDEILKSRTEEPKTGTEGQQPTTEPSKAERI